MREITPEKIRKFMLTAPRNCHLTLSSGRQQERNVPEWEANSLREQGRLFLIQNLLFIAISVLDDLDSKEM